MVRDANGNLMDSDHPTVVTFTARADVTFCPTTGCAGTESANTNLTCTTDASGVCRIKTKTAKAGDYTIEATIEETVGVPLPLTAGFIDGTPVAFQYHSTGDTANARYTFATGPTDVTASGVRIPTSAEIKTANNSDTHTLTAILRDARDNAVSGQSVTFAATQSVAFCAAGGCTVSDRANEPRTCTTGDDGTCSILAKSTVADPNGYQIAASWNSAPLTAKNSQIEHDSVIYYPTTDTTNARYSFESGVAVAAESGVRAAVNNAPANGDAAGPGYNTLTAMVRDAIGNGVSGQLVYFTATPGVTLCKDDESECVTTDKSCITGFDGTCSIKAKSTTAGSHATVVTLAGDPFSGGPFYDTPGGNLYLDSPVSYNFTFGAADAAGSGVRAVSTNAVVGGVNVLETMIRDANEARVQGATVTFAGQPGLTYCDENGVNGCVAQGADKTCATSATGVCRIGAKGASATGYDTPVKLGATDLTGAFTADTNTYAASPVNHTFTGLAGDIQILNCSASPGYDPAKVTYSSNRYTPTGSGAWVCNAAIEAKLNAGVSQTVDSWTGAGGTGAIIINAPIVKTAGADCSLTLNASRRIALDNDITSSTGKLNITLKANDAGANDTTLTGSGNLDSAGGRVTFYLPAGIGSIGGEILGSGEVNKSGFGTLILAGTGDPADSWSGRTNIYEGTLQIGAGNSTGRLNPNTQIANYDRLMFNTATALTHDGLIGGRGTLEQKGPGTITLAGANTFYGPLAVSGGTLAAGSATAFGNKAPVTVSAGGTLDLNGNSLAIGSLAGDDATALVISSSSALLTTGSLDSATAFAGKISGSLNLSKSGTGIFTLTGANDYSGTTSIVAGILQVGDGGASGQLGTGAVANAAGLVFNRDETSELTVGNIISGDGTLTQAGTGITVLEGASDYSGATYVNAGTLAVTHATALGAAGGTTSVAGGATLDLRAVTGVTENVIVDSNGSLTTTTGTSSLTGTVTLNDDAIIHIPGTQLTIEGVIGDGGTNRGLTKTGPGILLLAAANTYTGPTAINGGTLRAGHAQALGTCSAVTLGDITDTRLDLNDISLEVGSIAGGGTTGGHVINTGGSGTGTLITGCNDLSTTYQGEMQPSGNAVALTKTGDGTLTLSGLNAHTGATSVDGGTLAVTSGAGLGSNLGNTIINPGGILDLKNAITSSEPVTLGGGLLRCSDTATLSGPVTLNTNSTIEVSGSLLTLQGAIGGGFGFTKTGSGELALTSSASTYTGATVIEEGTLTPTSPANGGSTSSLGAATADVANLVLSGGTLKFTGTGATNRGFTLTNGTMSTIEVGSGSTLTMNGASATSSGGFTKTGGGVLIFGNQYSAATNPSGGYNYTGETIISAGELRWNGINRGSAFGTSAKTVLAGATFAGDNGSASGPVTIKANGAIRGGSGPGSKGRLFTGGPLSIEPGGIIEVTTDGTTASLILLNASLIPATTSSLMGTFELKGSAFQVKIRQPLSGTSQYLVATSTYPAGAPVTDATGGSETRPHRYSFVNNISGSVGEGLYVRYADDRSGVRIIRDHTVTNAGPRHPYNRFEAVVLDENGDPRQGVTVTFKGVLQTEFCSGDLAEGADGEVNHSYDFEASCTGHGNTSRWTSLGFSNTGSAGVDKSCVTNAEGKCRITARYWDGTSPIFENQTTVSTSDGLLITGDVTVGGIRYDATKGGSLAPAGNLVYHLVEATDTTVCDIEITDSAPTSGGVTFNTSTNTFELAEGAGLVKPVRINAADITAKLNAGTPVTINTRDGDCYEFGSVTVNGEIRKTGGGEAALNVLYTGNLRINEDIISQSGPMPVTFDFTAFQVAGNGGIDLREHALSGPGNINTNGGKLEFKHLGDHNTSLDLSALTGVISGSGELHVYSRDTSKALILAGNNTYTGNTYLDLSLCRCSAG
jgi:fibronectin-binding autotransporter adhesin